MKVDMSPKAVKGRLKMVSQLLNLSVSLRDAKKETDERRRAERESKKDKTNRPSELTE